MDSAHRPVVPHSASIETRVALLEQQGAYFMQMLEEQKEFTKQAAQAMSALARLEEQAKAAELHRTQAAAVHDQHAKRLGKIEQLIPGLTEKSTWITAGLLTVVSLVILAAVKFILFGAGP